MTFTHSQLADVAAASSKRLAKRRRQRQSMVHMAMVSYAIDLVLLLALSWAGGVPMGVAFGYFGAGLFACLCFHRLLGTNLSERFSDHYMAGPQMVVHAIVNLGTTLLAPQIGLLMMTTMFIVFAFGALRVNPRDVVSGPMVSSAIVATGVIAVLILAGERMSLPAATWQQRAVCGLWVALVLARSTGIGMYSAQLRARLSKRSLEVEATFEKLEVLAHRDELTGAKNRRSIMKLLDDECERMRRTGKSFGVALFDIDHFKRINDDYGHLAGDDALRHFAEAAQNAMRSTDQIGRYGGEEFLMMLSGVGEVAVARVAAERVRRATAEYDWGNKVALGMKVTVSSGVAICKPGETPKQLLHRADRALYTAKHEGRNCVREASQAAPSPAQESPYESAPQ